MGKRILVPVDGSDQARAAVEFAFEEFPDGEVLLLHVINPAEAGYGAQSSLPTFPEEWYQQETDTAEELFAEIRELAPDPSTIVQTEAVVGRPAGAIVAYADEHDVDQIVMGSHGRSGVSRILLGSVAESVVRKASVPVTVTR
ncbi:MAG: universal stress protein [Haloarculaceae archaeon]